MRLNKYQKEIARGMETLKAKTPPYKLRSEKETEELLHKYRVLARIEQIKMVKLEYQEYPHPILPDFDRVKYLLKLGKMYLESRI